MAVTLAQLAQIETDVLKKYIIANLLREIKMMEILPFDSVNSLSSIAVRYKQLPSTAFRYINGGYTPSEGQLEQVWESVYGLGGEILFDRVFELVGNTIKDMRQIQTDMKLLSLALTFNNYLINGDLATDPLGFEGLKKRVSLMPTRQTVYFAGSSSAALDVTASTANANTFFSKLEEMHYKTNRGQVNAFLMNEAMLYGIGRAARYVNSGGGNFLSTTKDSFDRDIMTYKGARCIDVGFKVDQTTEIIPDNETAGDAGTDATSIYGVSFDEMQGVRGIQLNNPDVYDPLNGGEKEAAPQKMLRIDWWLGLATWGNFGVTRGQNVEGASNWTA